MCNNKPNPYHTDKELETFRQKQDAGTVYEARIPGVNTHWITGPWDFNSTNAMYREKPKD